MGIGLKRGSVAVVPHQVEWETTAKQTIKELKLILELEEGEMDRQNTEGLRAVKILYIIL